MKSVQDRIEAATKEKLDPAELSDFVEMLRDNMNKTGAQSTQALGLFLVLATAWILVRSAVVQRLSVMGAEIGRVEVILLLLPAVAAFFHYRYQCAMAMSDTIDAALRRLYAQKFPALDKHNLTELIAHPGFHTVENAMANLETGILAKAAKVWVVAMVITFSLLPMVALLGCSWWLLVAPPMGRGPSLVCVTMVLLFEIRTLLVFIQWMRQV